MLETQPVKPILPSVPQALPCNPLSPTQAPVSPKEVALEAVASFLEGRPPASEHALAIRRDASNAMALGHAVDLRILYSLVRLPPSILL